VLAVAEVTLAEAVRAAVVQVFCTETLHQLLTQEVEQLETVLAEESELLEL
jgi:hypothetical protein